ncbi:MAG: IS3 family transposase [Clostridia bacterium]|nr:IS3 family transposase [Clostridia bacterium]
MKATKEQKESVVQRYLSGESVENIIAEMQISRSSLYLWAKQYKEELKEKEDHVSVGNYRKLQNKVKRLEEMVEILRKANCHYNSPLREKLYALEELYGQYSVHLLCDTMGVSRATLYNHVLRNKKENTVNARRKEELKEQIQKVYHESNQIFGAAKITAVLRSQGIKVCDNTVREIMRDLGLKSIRQDSKRLYDRDKKKNRNLLQRQFNPEKPNQVWVSDVTDFRVNYKNYFICVILDLYSRLVVGYRIALKNSSQLTKSTFKLAYAHRTPGAGLIFHSDNGSNYCSKAFQAHLKSLLVTQSFSRPYTPYDNSVMESFFSSLKQEELYRRKIKSEKEFYVIVGEYINFYNEKRPHYQNSYKTPMQKEKEYFEANSI